MKRKLFYQNRLFPLNIYRLYDFVAKAYSRDEPKFRDDIITRPLIVEIAKLKGYGKEMIDIGCGDGHISRLIAPFSESVLGIDISDAMLIEARQKSHFFRNLDFVKANFLNLNALNRKFDIALGIFAFCCVKSIKELDLAFNNLYSILRKDGYAIIQIPNDKEVLAESKSEWIAEMPYSNTDIGKIIFRQLKTVDNNWVNVARYHYRLDEYLQSIKNANFKIENIIEPKATSHHIKIYPSLKNEGEIPASIIFVLKK